MLKAAAVAIGYKISAYSDTYAYALQRDCADVKALQRLLNTYCNELTRVYNLVSYGLWLDIWTKTRFKSSGMNVTGKLANGDKLVYYSGFYIRTNIRFDDVMHRTGTVEQLHESAEHVLLFDRKQNHWVMSENVYSKKENMAYWGTLHDIAETFVRQYIAQAVKPVRFEYLDKDDTILEIAKAVETTLLKSLKDAGVDTDKCFPYVDENY